MKLEIDKVEKGYKISTRNKTTPIVSLSQH